MEQKVAKIDLVGNRRWWFTFSGVILVVGLYFLFTQGLNSGIDFTGGTEVKYKFARSVPVSERVAFIGKIRDVLGKFGLVKSEIKLSDETKLKGLKWVVVKRNNIIVIRTKELKKEKVDEITKSLGEKIGEVEELGNETVGPVIGRELKNKAIAALMVGCLFILLYLTIRYEFKFAVAAIIALIHDALVMVGLFALLRPEVNSPFVAALLTIIGYSVNDTVVIFDRIRENVKLTPREPFDQVVNFSLLQTMARSINTVATVEFMVIALFLFGGATIHTFALALLIGITVGCYSSIFNAAQVVVSWRALGERRLAAPVTVKEPVRKLAPAAPTAKRPQVVVPAGREEEVVPAPAGIPKIKEKVRKKKKKKKRRRR